MPTTLELILQHSVNNIHNPQYTSSTNKAWAAVYPAIDQLTVRTTVNHDGAVHATFEPAFLPLSADEDRRTSAPAYPPNERFWRLETEADAEHWWHTEISDIVLAAWASRPCIVQTCHTTPLTDVNITENVDCTYAMYIGNERVPIAIGEMKRNLINADEWQSSRLSTGQQRLARELRGYADKYQCPQVFCWDGRTLLMLQFRARKPEHIRKADCRIDCWVIPVTGSTCTLRYALYRLMVQGLRRCQASVANQPLKVGSLTEHGREFFSGRPIWKLDGQSVGDHPEGYLRAVHAATGALYWNHEQAEDVVWETPGFWEP